MRYETLKNAKFKELLRIVDRHVQALRALTESSAGVTPPSLSSQYDRVLAELATAIGFSSPLEHATLKPLLEQLFELLERGISGSDFYLQLLDSQFAELLALQVEEARNLLTYPPTAGAGGPSIPAASEAVFSDVPTKAAAKSPTKAVGTRAVPPTTAAAALPVLAVPRASLLTSTSGDPVAPAPAPVAGAYGKVPTDVPAKSSVKPAAIAVATPTPAPAGGAGAGVGVGVGASDSSALSAFFPQRLSLTIDRQPVDLGLAVDFFENPVDPKHVFMSPRFMLTTPVASPRQIVFLADTSGSMNEDDGLGINAVKTILRRVYQNLLSTDQVSLITFSNGMVKTVLPLTSKTTADASFNRQVDNLIAYGGTPLNRALLSVGHIPGLIPGHATVIVLTDGVDDARTKLPEQVISELKTSLGGFLPRILPIGLGRDYDQAWAKAMGRATFGYIDARDMRNVTQHTDAILGAIAHGINLRLIYSARSVAPVATESADLGIIAFDQVTQDKAVLMTEPAFTEAGRLRIQTRGGVVAVDAVARIRVTEVEQQIALLTTWLIDRAKAIYYETTKSPAARSAEIEGFQADYERHGLVSDEARSSLRTLLVVLEQKRLLEEAKAIAYIGGISLRDDAMPRITAARARGELTARYPENSGYLDTIIDKVKEQVRTRGTAAGVSITATVAGGFGGAAPVVGLNLTTSLAGGFVGTAPAVGLSLLHSTRGAPAFGGFGGGAIGLPPVASAGLVSAAPVDEDPAAVTTNRLNLLTSATGRPIASIVTSENPLAFMRGSAVGRAAPAASSAAAAPASAVAVRATLPAAPTLVGSNPLPLAVSAHGRAPVPITAAPSASIVPGSLPTSGSILRSGGDPAPITSVFGFWSSTGASIASAPTAASVVAAPSKLGGK